MRNETAGYLVQTYDGAITPGFQLSVRRDF